MPLRFLQRLLLFLALGPCAASPAYSALKVRVRVADDVPKLTLVAGKRLQIAFDSTHIAELAVKQVRKTPYVVKLQMNDNSCGLVDPKSSCELKYDVILNLFTPVWSSHPDPEKISRPIQSRAKELTPIITLVDSSMRHLVPGKFKYPFSEDAQGLKATQLSCGGDVWTNFQNDFFETVNFESLSNTDGYLESKVRRIFRKQKFKRSANGLEFLAMDKFRLKNFTAQGGILSPLISEKVGFVFRKGGNTCRTVFNTDATRSRLAQVLIESSAGFTPVDFSKLPWSPDSLTALQDDEFAAYNPKLREIYAALSDDLKMLFLLSLVEVEVTNPGENVFDLNITRAKVE